MLAISPLMRKLEHNKITPNFLHNLLSYICICVYIIRMYVGERAHNLLECMSG